MRDDPFAPPPGHRPAPFTPAGLYLPPGAPPAGRAAVAPRRPPGDAGYPFDPVRDTAVPRPAGFFRRALAFMADLLVVEFMAVMLGSVATMGQLLSGDGVVVAESAQETSVMFAAQAFPLLGFCYFFFFTAYGGRTPGKMLLGMRVATVDGEAPGWRRSLARTLCYLLSVLTWGIGFLLAMGPAKRALHDRLTGTRVVLTTPPAAAPG
ncbi:MAG: RDD family protein [Nitrospirae bacterium]|nr:RDD family protein [Nitrospirota bacterium]